MAEITCRVRPSSDRWYDSECRSAKRHARRLERCYKKTGSTAAREHWVEALGSMHRLVRSKRDAAGGRKLTLDAIRRLFGVRLTKDWAGEELAPRIRPLVSQLRPSPTSSIRRVSDVRSATDGAPAPEVRDIL